MIRYLAFLLLVLFLPLPAACGDRPAAAPRLLARECLSCHQPRQICWQIGSKDEREWQRTLQRMGDYGARLSYEERKTLIVFLMDKNSAESDFCTGR